MRTYINTLIIAITIILCVKIFSGNLIALKVAQNNYITVTGSATKSFASDLIVWRGSFSKTAKTTKEAFEGLKTDTVAVKNYLVAGGVPESSIIFSSIQTNENYDYEYNQDGRMTKQTFTGYTLTQQVKIESSDVDTTEKISRDITALIDVGVAFFSMPPEYYYTRLDEVKLDLIKKATENARLRAETISHEGGGKLAKLRTAYLGVFQITPENSSTENYSSTGAYDVSSKNKTAFITTRLEYVLK
ncbi:MAG: SIMPL domain-containing protein [Spirochaetaceae bacterium]|jgi:hypothetical protein|nr:SIMPL domain-containing protein [Spirochaetaceae bacterium]